jgi:hypothetical protein
VLSATHQVHPAFPFARASPAAQSRKIADLEKKAVVCTSRITESQASGSVDRLLQRGKDRSFNGYAVSKQLNDFTRRVCSRNVRTDSDPLGILATVQRQVRIIDPHVEVEDVRTIQKVIGQALFGATIGVGLLAVFGLIALGLASLGLYGAMAHAVAERQREVGVRMALGARRLAVMWLAASGTDGRGCWRGVRYRRVGTRRQSVVARAVWRDHVRSPQRGRASVVLVLTAAAACYVPARRASLLDPLTALREG